ncbi:MAG: type II toxin-antitoxin system VapC family toxin [Chloroflexota bacterium]
MNLYLDSSALAKRYVEESGSEDVLNWMDLADTIGTGLITRAEVVAAITRATRTNRLTTQVSVKAISKFRQEWGDFHRIPINEALVARADFLACQHGLRGYDAIHLASALIWQEALMLPVALATYDQELAEAGQKSGLQVLP